jgi:hypothetical protein
LNAQLSQSERRRDIKRNRREENEEWKKIRRKKGIYE